MSHIYPLPVCPRKHLVINLPPPSWKSVLKLTLSTCPNSSFVTQLFLYLEKASANFLHTASADGFPVGFPLGK